MRRRCLRSGLLITSLALSLSRPLTASQCLPDAGFTSTPVLAWDRVAHDDLAGYRLFYRGVGGTFQTLVDLPILKWWCHDPGDPVILCEFHPGADLGIPIQRYLGDNWQCQTLEFAVKAYDEAGNLSLDYSNVVTLNLSDWWQSGEVCCE